MFGPFQTLCTAPVGHGPSIAEPATPAQAPSGQASATTVDAIVAQYEGSLSQTRFVAAAGWLGAVAAAGWGVYQRMHRRRCEAGLAPAPPRAYVPKVSIPALPAGMRPAARVPQLPPPRSRPAVPQLPARAGG
jgi:hypothetical protein